MSSSGSGGFWKRLGTFIKNPTRDWSLTDEQALRQHESLAEAKAREEQKRRNDFIRKRELDALRKLRKRETTDPGISDSLLTHVTDLNSQPASVLGRDETLRKINEIEKSMEGDLASVSAKSRSPVTRQMSVSPSSRLPPPLPSDRPSAIPPLAAVSPTLEKISGFRAAPSTIDTAYADTALMAELGGGAATATGRPTPSNPTATPATPTTPPPLDFPTVPHIPTAPQAQARRQNAAPPPLDGQPTPAVAPHASAHAMSSQAASGDSWLRSSSDFMPSAYFAVEVHEALSSNPLFDQAVMDFANGNDAAAEAALRDAISNAQDLNAEKELWLALFDLFRASRQIEKFEALVVDFVSRFQISAPMIDDDLPAASSAPKPADTGFRPSITFSESVDSAQSERLRKLLLNNPPALELNFTKVRSIAAAALPTLVEALKKLNQTACSVTLHGADNLLALCQTQAPAMQREADAQWWALRLELLRLLNQQDDFDAVALDYCVTYEISPPSWEPSRARVDFAGADGAAQGTNTTLAFTNFQNSLLGPQSVLGSSRTAQVHLSGEITGGSSAFLDPLDRAAKTHEQMSISLRQLRRIDFSSASALLNWVIAQHHAGKTLQFTGVLRLIAGLFNILGLHEHAAHPTQA